MQAKIISGIFSVLFLLFHTHVDAQVVVHLENFNSGIGTWTAVNVADAGNVWTPTSGYMQMNGIGGSNDEDWLISPSINMDAQGNEYFMFDYYDTGAGNLIEVYYSANYNNGGTAADVSSATWTLIPLRILDMNAISCVSTGVFQRHPAIDVSGITGTSVYFAFKYTGTSALAKQYQIDNVRILGDYYANLSGTTSCAPLKQELHDLIVNQPDRIRYTSSTLYDVWDAFLHTDTRLNDAGTATIVWDMFTDMPNTTGEFEFDHCANRDGGSCPGGEGICYNREHSFPKSWWGGGTTLSDTIYTDLHHIYPSDRQMNIIKSNYPPGNVLSSTSTGSNGFTMGTNSTYPCTPTSGAKNYFEPIDEYKGDYARTYFYVVTRYQHNMAAWQTINGEGACFMDGTTYPSIQGWALQTLLEWHAADPVSQKEIDHNNAVYAIQGNRNPYIDDSGLVYLVWGDAFGTPCSSVILPVELIEFDAAMDQDVVDLTWETATENNSDYFLVERSVNGYNWEAIGKVAASGNSLESQHYLTQDRSPLLGVSYYRLKEVDLDGNTVFSQVRTVNNTAQLLFYPNPVHGVLMISGKMDENSEVEVLDIYGRNVAAETVIKQLQSDQITIDMSALPSNVYIVRVGGEMKRIVKD